MAFTALPRMFDSTAGELIYTIEGLDTAHYTSVRIMDTRRGRTLAIKRFYRTATATVNVAPAARTAIRFTPLSGPTGIYPTAERSAQIAVDAAGERSPVRLFTAGSGLPGPPSVLTTLPARRTLARGEYDELTLLVPDNCLVELTRRFSDGRSVAESFQLLSVTCSEPVAFLVRSDQYVSDTECLEVAIRSGGEVFRTFTYNFVTRPVGSRRIAWRSSHGSIEHFTFPAEKELVQAVGQDNVPVRQEAVFGQRTRILTLLSGYQPRTEIAALAEIVRSPDVWIATGSGYVRVVPEGGRHELRSGSGPVQLELSLRIPETCAL